MPLPGSASNEYALLATVACKSLNNSFLTRAAHCGVTCMHAVLYEPYAGMHCHIVIARVSWSTATDADDVLLLSTLNEGTVALSQAGLGVQRCWGDLAKRHREAAQALLP